MTRTASKADSALCVASHLIAPSASPRGRTNSLPGSARYRVGSDPMRAISTVSLWLSTTTIGARSPHAERRETASTPGLRWCARGGRTGPRWNAFSTTGFLHRQQKMSATRFSPSLLPLRIQVHHSQMRPGRTSLTSRQLERTLEKLTEPSMFSENDKGLTEPLRALGYLKEPWKNSENLQNLGDPGRTVENLRKPQRPQRPLPCGTSSKLKQRFGRSWNLVDSCRISWNILESCRSASNLKDYPRTVENASYPRMDIPEHFWCVLLVNILKTFYKLSELFEDFANFDAHFQSLGTPFGAVESCFVPRRTLWGLTMPSGAFSCSLQGALRRLLEQCSTFWDIKEHG